MGFALGRYDASRALVIGPVLVSYSTYLGGSNRDYAYGIAVDAAGAAYVTGLTGSSDFPTASAFDATYNGGSFDAFVTKLSADGSDTPGVFVPATSRFFLRNALAPGPADLSFGYGPAGAGWIPLTGDWDGDGADTVGLYNPATGTFFLKNSNAGGAADLVYGFGPDGAGWTPLAGDWDGDGVDTVGLFAPASSRFFLRNVHAGGAADLAYGFGPAGAGWVALAGDWNGDRVETVGLYAPSSRVFFLRDVHAGGAADHVFSFGPLGVTPLVGDWDGQ